ncbi:isochorismatase family cysteine hydrolase [Pseudothermotoga sp. U03pept]|uniref:isochorismatase family cysteine hydrolase n=1 Tax=Pseudothermotoga sp. U03pept TaxID=3447012 RepID=UPI00309F4235
MFFTRERKKHPCRIDVDRVALLVIDAQRYFCDPQSEAYLHGVENALQKVNSLLKVFEERSLPIFCTVHKGNSDAMKRWWGNSVEGKQIQLSIKPVQAQVIYKDSYDAFHMTELEESLKKKQVNQLVVCGVMTHLCVETTVRSAFVKGYELIVVEDACWDKDDFYHFSSLKSMAHGFAIISSAGEIECMLGS